MADDKGGSSGSSWSAIEIIVVLVLVLALLGRFFGTGKDSVKVPDVATYKGTEQTTPGLNDCGKLLLTRPKPLEKVAISATGLTVQGTVTTCNTIAVAADTFYVTIVDAKGQPLSETIAVPVNETKDIWTLNGFVQFSIPPVAGNGSVIVTRANNTGTPVANGGARMPIRFVNQ